MINWTKEAEEAVETLPLPDMITPYAKLECERLAKKKGIKSVTTEIVEEADKRYEFSMGRDVARRLRAMMRGEDASEGVLILEEFFADDSRELFSITQCPSKYGAASDVKIENMKRLVPAIRDKLKELKVTDLMMNLAADALMPHSVFKVNITGCTNACFSPYFSDFGVLGVYYVELIPEKCTGCGLCVDFCITGAITMKDNLPNFNKNICVRCAGCEEFCPDAAIGVEKMGYKVVVGGNGARYPKIAQTVTEFTDIDGVLKVLEKTINLLRDKAKKPMRIFYMRKFISDDDINKFKD